ncbi:MAG: cyclase [bacterium]|jgi:cyclase
MAKWNYTEGLHSIGNGVFAYLQPDGSWGWNNAGLIEDSGHSMLVDTLFDLKQTGKMLRQMRATTSSARNIQAVINTHANGDHCWGNQLVSGAEIISSRKGALEMEEFRPETMAKLMKIARILDASGNVGKVITQILKKLGLSQFDVIREAAPFVLEAFQDFDFNGIRLVSPTKTFDDQLDIHVGNKMVRLLEVGPAHTHGDILVHVPDDRVIFTGDILFIGGHPIVWAGPVSNWIKACNLMLEMDVESVVPGHGPVTDKDGVKQVRDYLQYIHDEAKKRYLSGMCVEEAVRDITFEDYDSWGESERIAVNLRTLYREFSGDCSKPNIMVLFAEMSKLWKDRKKFKV